MKQKTKRNIAIGIAFVLVFAILVWLITAAAMNTNAICLFGHNYGEDGKCVRCGADKPINQDTAMLLNSADNLKYFDGIDCREIKAGDNLSYVYQLFIYVYGYLDDYNEFQDGDVRHVQLFKTNNAVICFYYTFTRGEEHPFYWTVSLNSVDYSTLTSYGHHSDDVDVEYVVLDSRDSDFINCNIGIVSEYLAEAEIYAAVEELDIRPLETPTKEGYDFIGWFLDEACTKPYDLDYVTGDTTLYAGWKLKEYTVILTSDGEQFAAVTVTHGSALTLPEDTPSKTGYRFVGWLFNGTPYTNQPITANTTLTARFEIIRCTLTFIVDGKEFRKITVDYGTPVSSIFQKLATKIMFKTASADVLAMTIEGDTVINAEFSSFGEFITQPWVMGVGIALGVCILCAIISVIVAAVKKKRDL